jgi:hypothetical protein
VTHCWTEHGQAKSHVETIAWLPAKYKIRTAADPDMVSVSYEMPSTRSDPPRERKF